MLNHFFSIPIYIEAPAMDAHISHEIETAIATSTIKNDWQPTNDTANTTFSSSGDINIVKSHQMHNMARFIMQHAGNYLNQTKQSFNDKSIRIVESWINTFDNNQVIGWHGHGYQPNTISGCYYHKAPVGCGRIHFKSPNPYNISFPHHSTEYPSIVNIDPEPGMIVLFPNWIQHGTEPNRVSDTRVSLAFNIEFDYTWD